MPLPHFTEIVTSNNQWEPVYKNLFEVEMYLPDIIKDKHPNGTALLLENIRAAKLPTYPDLPTVKQWYKYSTRIFLGFPESTSIDSLEFGFNINQNDAKQMFTFRMMKDLYDISFNNEDGSSNYKKNASMEIILYQHDRQGNIIRRVTYHNCLLHTFSVGEDLVWGGGAEIQELTAGFAVDYFEDYYF